jgi:hypothetical protein
MRWLKAETAVGTLLSEGATHVRFYVARFPGYGGTREWWGLVVEYEDAGGRRT